jgi:hypothetical protein
MAIPRARDVDVPPPLPPPRYIGEQLSSGQDPGWQWGNTVDTGFGGVKPGSSLLGGARGPVHRHAEDDMSSDSLEDEDHGKSRPRLAGHR